MNNVYRALFGNNAPFMGEANEKYTQNLRRGYILKVNDELTTLVAEDQSNSKRIENITKFQTLDINWIDGQPFTSYQVPFSMQISNSGYGVQCLPEEGDIVLASFLPHNQPIIQALIKQNAYYQSGKVDLDTGEPVLNEQGDPIANTATQYTFYPLRKIKKGEYQIISKKQAEFFLDDYGTIKLIVRDQNHEEKEYGKRAWEISLGSQILDETNKEIKKLENENIQFQVYNHDDKFNLSVNESGTMLLNNDKNNIRIGSDGVINIKNGNGDTVSMSEGELIIKSAGGESITITKDSIKIGTQAGQSAVLGENLKMLLDMMMSIFNGHTHIYSPGPGTPTPTAPPAITMVSNNYLSKKVKLK